MNSYINVLLHCWLTVGRDDSLSSLKPYKNFRRLCDLRITFDQNK